LVCGTDETGAGGGIGGSGTLNYVAKFTAATTIGNSQIFDDGTSVGIGTTTPGAAFHVYNYPTTTNNQYGLRVETNRSGVGTTGYGIYGSGITTNPGGSDAVWGVRGYASGANVNNYGLFGMADGSWGTKYGVRGNGYGSGTNYGVYGHGSGGTISTGVRGYANGATTNYGVRGDAVGDTGTKYALYGFTNGLGTKYGVYTFGEDKNYFSGNVGIGTTTPTQKLDVNGNVNVGGNITMGWERTKNTCTSCTSTTLTCSAGKKVLGGGCGIIGLTAARLKYSGPIGDTQWQCITEDIVPTLDGYIICARIN